MKTIETGTVRLFRLMGFAVALFVVAAACIISSAHSTHAESGGTTDAGTPVTVYNNPTWFIYLKSGETVTYNFQHTTIPGNGLAAFQEDVVITVDGVDGVHQETTIPAGTDGTSTFTNSFTATTDGVWHIRLAGTTDAIARISTAWDISVYDNDNTYIPGRVWTNKYSILQQGAIAYSTNLNLWYLREDGYKYQGTYLNFNGINSIFQANSTGIVNTGTCSPAYRSARLDTATTANPLNEVSGYSMPDESCTRPYKIFFAEPAADLPESATQWDNSTIEIAPPIREAELSNLDFAFSGDQSKLAGEITFDVENYLSTATVLIDTNTNGSFNDSVDRTLYASPSSSGSGYTVTFDGKDGLGNDIPPSRKITIRVLADRPGEIHFVNSDVEHRSSGISVQRLNGTTSSQSLLSWNDSYLSLGGCNIPDEADLVGNMVDSTGGVHAWSASGCAGMGNSNGGAAVSIENASWGDARSIDDWTWDVGAEVQEISITLQPQIRLNKTVEAENVTVNTPFSYTLTVSSIGQIGTSEVTTVVDTLPAELALVASSLPSECSSQGQVITCETTDTILPGATKSFTFAVSASQVKQNIINGASTFGGGDEECVDMVTLAARCQSTATVNIVPNPPNTGIGSGRGAVILPLAGLSILTLLIIGLARRSKN